MNLYLATSCLQGRLLSEAARDLLSLGCDGLQLCPGNVVDCDGVSAPTRTHHGFSWHAMKRPVWRDGDLLVNADSVHPPKSGESWNSSNDAVYEVMYPGYWLGCGLEVNAAMDLGLRLAVDVSHVFIQLQSGAMLESTKRRLFEYERIAEVHVSANDGHRDSHRSIARNSFGLEWARSRGVPVILESYMHRLSFDERRQQIDIVRG